jgi:penicillin amidase
MKKWSIRIVLGLLALVVLVLAAIWIFLRSSLPQLDGQVREAGMIGKVTVERDDHGVPMIKGSHRNDIAYATGFIHAQDRFFQMDLLRRGGAGELSELFGPKALEMDKSRRMHRFRARAEQVLAAMPAAERAFLDRYVKGVNDGLNALGARPFEYGLINVAPRPWSAADSLLAVWAMYFDLQGNIENREIARGWLRQNATPEQLAVLLPEATVWDAPLDAEGVEHTPAPFPAEAPAWWGAKPREMAPLRMASADFIDAVGSNNWAIAGSRSSNGSAIVADDMHLGISLPNTWYRLAMEYPGLDGKRRRIVGVTLPGAPPVVVAGSNGKVAWGYTNSYGDFVDLVTLGDSDKITDIEETILVKGGDPHKFIVRESAYGPVRQAGGRNMAVRWVAHDRNALNLNILRLESAATVDEALSVAATVGIPAQNFVTGDSAGNIGWTIAGLLPERDQHGAGSTFPMSGDDPLLWKGMVAPADYPRIVNPASGQISTANSRQLDGAGASVIGDGGFDLGARAHQIRNSLKALGETTDVKGVYSVMLDDRAVFISTWRERLLKVLDAAALKGHPARAELRALVEKSWDGRASTSSVGYRLSRHMMWAMHDLMYDGALARLADSGAKGDMHLVSSRWPVLMTRLLDEQPAGWLPKGYTDWRAVQLAAIDRVIAEQTKDGKKLAEATWGARNTASFAHPISRAVPALKAALGAPADQLPGDANMPRVAGATFGQSERIAVSPGHEEEGIFNMPGGQSGHPLSPYFLKGHDDWVKGTPRPLLPGPARHTLTFSR